MRNANVFPTELLIQQLLQLNCLYVQENIAKTWLDIVVDDKYIIIHLKFR